MPVAGLVVLFAHLWLRYFRRGPLEWLWHAARRVLARAPRTPPSALAG